MLCPEINTIKNIEKDCVKNSISIGVGVDLRGEEEINSQVACSQKSAHSSFTARNEVSNAMKGT